MKVIYAQQPIPDLGGKQMIFLVGPTPRSSSVPSWRPGALSLLEDKGFDGNVFVPEPEGGDWVGDYIDQIGWEDQALTYCGRRGCIAAWVPRDLETMPAFTTNVEFGLYLLSGRLLYGRPPGAPKTSYLDRMYQIKTGTSPYDSLEDLMEGAVGMARRK